MSKMPPIPPEQRSFRGERPHIEGDGHEPRETSTNKGEAANIRQNLRPQRQVQDR